MAQAGSLATNHLVTMLREPTGLALSVTEVASRAGISLEGVEPSQIVARNVAFELAERTAGAQYPAIYVYCEKISNLLTEKFRTFSGKARMAIDVRVTHDRLEEIGRQLELYVEAVTDVLDSHRGGWGQGMCYASGYEVSFGAVKHGGRNFIQSAKLVLDVDISLG